ncbi:MAG: Bax inhibitor-1/YccA family protein [Microbacteriaceae bacterium]|nr:Bax inhibitor-1/YccA family protein [Microbacteriaceae bacterium]
MSNPALSHNPALNGKTLTAEELQRIYDQPAANVQRSGVDAAAASAAGVAAAKQGIQFGIDGGSAQPMTYENTISKTVFLFIIVVVSAAVGWWMMSIFPAIVWIGLAVGFVLGLVNAFKKEPSVPLIMGYAVGQGLFLGGLSMMFNTMYDGIVTQAILGTLSVFAGTLLLFRSGKVRTSPKMNKIVMIAMLGDLGFSLLNLGLMAFGVVTNPWGLRSGWVGVAIGVVAVLLAAYSLVMDFELIKNGVENRVPEKWGWSAAFGLMVTLIWLYVEILRILAIMRGD